ncbi:unnamed protein product, partial [Pylaiella littoralis]
SIVVISCLGGCRLVHCCRFLYGLELEMSCSWRTFGETHTCIVGSPVSLGVSTQVSYANLPHTKHGPACDGSNLLPLTAAAAVKGSSANVYKPDLLSLPPSSNECSMAGF